MPAFKDENNNTWYCKFYYTTYDNIKKQKMKRGFKRKKDALEFEKEFILKQQFQPDMTFKSFYELYKKDVFPQLRQHTIQSKEYKINRIMEYFSDYPINEISGIHIKRWQNELLNGGFSNRYMANLQSELSAIMNHAVSFYGLKTNPVSKVPKAKNPNEKPKIMRFWTFDEYSEVITNIDSIKGKCAIDLLYWTGMRKGELLALTWNKINFESNTVLIDQSLQRLNGKNVITPTKTYENRTLLIPDKVIRELKEYRELCFDTSANEPVFQWEKRFIEDSLKSGAEKANIKKIHVHGLRHSHASYLINKGVNIVLISKRLGHKNTSMTLDTYSHFYPTDEQNLIELINDDLK